MTSKQSKPVFDEAVLQGSDPSIQRGVERFFHHDKTEHPSTDNEMGKTPARPSDIREDEHKEKRSEEYAQHPLMQPTERRVKDAKKQADEYGREMIVPQTLPQTLLDEKNPFGASADSDVKESRNQVSLFPTVDRDSN